MLQFMVQYHTIILAPKLDTSKYLFRVYVFLLMCLDSWIKAHNHAHRIFKTCWGGGGGAHMCYESFPAKYSFNAKFS